MGHLAQFSRELYGTGRTESKPQSHGFPNKWTAPLVGMNIEHLKAFGSWWTWQTQGGSMIKLLEDLCEGSYFKDAWNIMINTITFLMFPLFHTCCHGGAISELYQKKKDPPAFSHYWSTHWERVLPNKNSRRSFFVTSLTVVETLLPKFCIATGRFFAFQICRVDNKIGWHKWNSLHNWHEWTWRWRRKMCIDIDMSKRASHGS